MRSALFSIILCFGVSLAAAEFDPALQGVRFFAYQLQNFETPAGLQALRDSHYDLLVIDQTRSIKGSEGYNSADDVGWLHATRGSSINGKKVVCYLDAGQAEDFRWYWRDGWTVGNPAWILAPDPDWPGDYPVKFWDPQWKALMKQDLAMIIADGYDGAYLDWMEIYAFEPLVQAAQAEGKDPREELIAFIRELRDYARSLDPDFFFIAQNAAELGACREWLDLFSGIGQEDVWFTWGDGTPGDVPQDPELTAQILENLALWKKAGKVVFTIEYAEEPANVATAYANGRAEGFITYATLKELDQISGTPPPDYKVHNITATISDGTGAASFSPDGQWVVFPVWKQGLYKARTDMTDMQLIVSDSDHGYDVMPGSSWNPILNRICFDSDRDGNANIYTISPEGSGFQQLTFGNGVNVQPTFSPDGRWIVFNSQRDGNWEIYKLHLETGELKRLTDSGGDDLQPNWSPTGDFIVFISDRAGSYEVWKMDPDGLSVERIIHEDSPWYRMGWPVVTQDGKWLLYYWDTGDPEFGNGLIIAPIATHSSPHEMISGNGFAGPASFSPDGKTVVFTFNDAYDFDLWTMPIYLPPPSPHERPVGRP